MARPLRFVYPGACYHLMARGDGGKMIFIEKVRFSSPSKPVGKVEEISLWGQSAH